MGRAASRSRPPPSSKVALRRRVALIASVGARASPSLPRCWLLGCRPLAASAADAAPCTRRGATAKGWNPHLRSDRRAFERGRTAESSARASRTKPPAANAETASRLGSAEADPEGSWCGENLRLGRVRRQGSDQGGHGRGVPNQMVPPPLSNGRGAPSIEPSTCPVSLLLTMQYREDERPAGPAAT